MMYDRLHIRIRLLINLGLFFLFILGTGLCAQAEGRKILVKLETSMGEITMEMFEDKAPDTVANFLQYVNDGFYDGLIFHRVIDGFMIQGGGMDANMNEKQTRAPVKNEADNGLKNSAYTVAMARTMDPHSATAQFFINISDNQFLNHTAKTAQGWGYAVFAQVIEGQDVVDKIKAVSTGNVGYHENVPQETVTIIKAVVAGQE